MRGVEDPTHFTHLRYFDSVADYEECTQKEGYEAHLLRDVRAPQALRVLPARVPRGRPRRAGIRPSDAPSSWSTARSVAAGPGTGCRRSCAAAGHEVHAPTLSGTATGLDVWVDEVVGADRGETARRRARRAQPGRRRRARGRAPRARSGCATWSTSTPPCPTRASARSTSRRRRRPGAAAAARHARSRRGRSTAGGDLDADDRRVDERAARRRRRSRRRSTRPRPASRRSRPTYAFCTDTPAGVPVRHHPEPARRARHSLRLDRGGARRAADPARGGRRAAARDHRHQEERDGMSVQPGWQGRFFEDFTVGDIYQHPLGRTVSEADNTWFSLLTMNTNQMHFNAEYAARSEFAEAAGRLDPDRRDRGRPERHRPDPERVRQPGLGRHQDDPPGLRRRHALQRVDRAGEARVVVAPARRHRHRPHPRR